MIVLTIVLVTSSLIWLIYFKKKIAALKTVKVPVRRR
jgi:hypothetical protein